MKCGPVTDIPVTPKRLERHHRQSSIVRYCTRDRRLHLRPDRNSKCISRQINLADSRGPMNHVLALRENPRSTPCFRPLRRRIGLGTRTALHHTWARLRIQFKHIHADCRSPRGSISRLGCIKVTPTSTPIFHYHTPPASSQLPSHGSHRSIHRPRHLCGWFRLC